MNSQPGIVTNGFKEVIEFLAHSPTIAAGTGVEGRSQDLPLFLSHPAGVSTPAIARQ